MRCLSFSLSASASFKASEMSVSVGKVANGSKFTIQVITADFPCVRVLAALMSNFNKFKVPATIENRPVLSGAIISIA